MKMPTIYDCSIEQFLQKTEEERQNFYDQLEEKYWWIIPFTYDKFIFELPKIKFDLRKKDFTTKDVCNFVYNYARDTRDYQTIETDGVTAFLVNSKPVQLYDTSKNEYMFRRLTGDYENI